MKHLQPMFHFCTPLKNWKTIGFPMVSEAREVKHWLEMSYILFQNVYALHSVLYDVKNVLLF